MAGKSHGASFGQSSRSTPQGDALFATIAGLADVVTPFVFATGAVVAAGAQAQFVKAVLGGGLEGLCLGVNFYVDSEDLQTSPVSLATISAQSNASVAGQQILGMGPWTAPLADPDGPPFMFPYLLGPMFSDGDGLALQLTNGEAVPIFCRGVLVGLCWASEHRPLVEQAVTEARSSLWRNPAFASKPVFARTKGA